MLQIPTVMPTLGDAIETLDDVTGSTSAKPARSFAAKKILVVDDEPEAVETMAAILREDGYAVDTAATA